MRTGGKRSLIQQVVTKHFSAVFDKPSWNVRQGYGSSIMFEFGQPSVMIHPVKGKPPRRLTVVNGEWHLWIWCCHWVIELKDKLSAHSESSRTEIESALVNLQGQMITKVTVEPASGKSLFDFDLGGSVRTWPYEGIYDSDGEPYPNWMFFENNEHYVLTYLANGKHNYGRADKKESNLLCP